MKEAVGEEDQKGDGERDAEGPQTAEADRKEGDREEEEGEKAKTEGEGGEKEDVKEKKTEMDLSTRRLCTFLELLNDVFWRLFVRRPSSAAVAPVVNPGGW